MLVLVLKKQLLSYSFASQLSCGGPASAAAGSPFARVADNGMGGAGRMRVFMISVQACELRIIRFSTWPRTDLQACNCVCNVMVTVPGTSAFWVILYMPRGEVNNH